MKKKGLLFVLLVVLIGTICFGVFLLLNKEDDSIENEKKVIEGYRVTTTLEFKESGVDSNNQSWYIRNKISGEVYTYGDDYYEILDFKKEDDTTRESDFILRERYKVNEDIYYFENNVWGKADFDNELFQIELYKKALKEDDIKLSVYEVGNIINATNFGWHFEGFAETDEIFGIEIEYDDLNTILTLNIESLKLNSLNEELYKDIVLKIEIEESNEKIEMPEAFRNKAMSASYEQELNELVANYFDISEITSITLGELKKLGYKSGVLDECKDESIIKYEDHVFQHELICGSYENSAIMFESSKQENDVIVVNVFLSDEDGTYDELEKEKIKGSYDNAIRYISYYADLYNQIINVDRVLNVDLELSRKFASGYSVVSDAVVDNNIWSIRTSVFQLDEVKSIIDKYPNHKVVMNLFAKKEGRSYALLHYGITAIYTVNDESRISLVLAHEMLHLLGTTDLYMLDVDIRDKYFLKEIMHTITNASQLGLYTARELGWVNYMSRQLYDDLASVAVG